jgi:hypothetical protein
MPPSRPKNEDQAQLNRRCWSGLERDIIWGRPVFRPPLLLVPQVSFDPFPLTAQRLPAVPRPTAGS